MRSRKSARQLGFRHRRDRGRKEPARPSGREGPDHLYVFAGRDPAIDSLRHWRHRHAVPRWLCCGRDHLPVLQEVTGRVEDAIVGVDGRQTRANARSLRRSSKRARRPSDTGSSRLCAGSRGDPAELRREGAADHPSPSSGTGGQRPSRGGVRRSYRTNRRRKVSSGCFPIAREQSEPRRTRETGITATPVVDRPGIIKVWRRRALGFRLTAPNL